MTQSTYPDINVQLAQADIFDPTTGHVDAVKTRELQKIVLADSNTVRVNGGGDHAQTLRKRKTARSAFLASQ